MLVILALPGREADSIALAPLGERGDEAARFMAVEAISDSRRLRRGYLQMALVKVGFDAFSLVNTLLCSGFFSRNAPPAFSVIGSSSSVGFSFEGAAFDRTIDHHGASELVALGVASSRPLSKSIELEGFL